MLQIFFEYLIKIEKSRLSVHESYHYHTVVFLKLRMLVKSVESYLWIGVALELNDYTHAVPVGFVSYGRYTFDPFILYKFSYFLKKS